MTRDSCDDGDQCTADSCQDNRCVHAQLTGIDGVSCRLATLDSELLNAGATNLGSAAREQALRAKISRAETLVEAGRPLSGRKQFRKFKGAGKQVRTFVRLVNRGQKHRKIAVSLAASLLDLATQTSTRLHQLVTP